MSKTFLWLGKYPVSDEKHVNDLEREAAINEFGASNMPRQQAEDLSYQNYKRKQHLEAAAHHWLGMKASTGKASKNHSALLAQHIKELGHDPEKGIPEEVESLVNSGGYSLPHSFKPHKSDGLLMHKSEEPLYLKTLIKAGVYLELFKAIANELGMTPAFRHTQSGEIVRSPGCHRLEVLPDPEEYDENWEDGWVDKNGKWYTREEAARALGTSHFSLLSQDLK